MVDMKHLGVRLTEPGAEQGQCGAAAPRVVPALGCRQLQPSPSEPVVGCVAQCWRPCIAGREQLHLVSEPLEAACEGVYVEAGSAHVFGRPTVECEDHLHGPARIAR